MILNDTLTCQHSWGCVNSDQDKDGVTPGWSNSVEENIKHFKRHMIAKREFIPVIKIEWILKLDAISQTNVF